MIFPLQHYHHNHNNHHLFFHFIIIIIINIIICFSSSSSSYDFPLHNNHHHHHTIFPLHHHHNHHHMFFPLHRHKNPACGVFGPVTSSGPINVPEALSGVVLGFERLVIPHAVILNTLQSQLQQPGRFFPLLISNIHALLILSVGTAFVC